MRKLALALAATAALLIAAPAGAATPIVNGSGQLTGATGVNILGSTYNVEFLDGTCVTLFGGCDASSDFAFHTLADADAASQALLDQVLVDGLYSFDTYFYLTNGCPSNIGSCVIITPYALGFDNSQMPVFFASLADNNGSQSGDVTSAGNGPITFDSGSYSGFTFARFTASAVPEPSTWAMILLGFGAIGFAMRRRKVPALA